MPKIVAPLLAGATYARLLHLLVGWIFAGVVLMIYPGTYHKSLGETLTASVAVDVVLLGLAALVPAARRAEGVQARLLLVPEREEDIGAEPSRGWADRRRTAGWLIGRVALGTAVGFTLAFGLPAAYRSLTGVGGVWGLPFAPLLLLGCGWLVVGAGRLQLAMAVALLGPSPAERLVEAELRAERLLERNRLARELHDSIGHALTVTVVQAGAAREVGDPAFAARALEVIEETGRRALEDLERTLVLLRETPAGAGGGAVTEQPGIGQLPALFETVRAAGSPVDARIEVTEAALPRVLSRESCRIVQEGVTNALKYAPGQTVEVRIGLRDGRLEMRCVNRLRGEGLRGEGGAVRVHGNSGPRGGGKGLRGIHERAALLGGRATAGPCESGAERWVLDVSLPLHLGT